MPVTHKKTKIGIEKLRILVVIFLLGVTVIAGSVLISNFKVEKIECQLDGNQCPYTLLTSLTVLQDKPLFFTNFEALFVEKGVPLPVTVTKIKKILPQTLQLEFSSQTLAYMLQTNEGQVAVSTTGILFKDITVSPPTTIEVTPELSTLLDPEHVVLPPIHNSLLELVTALESADLTVQHITWVDKDTIILIMNDGQLKALLDGKNPRVAIEKLKLIVKSQEYQAVQEKVQEIDLRFDLPVLRMRQ